MFAATGSHFVLPTSNQRSYEIQNVAAIDESPSTIGIADSEIFLQGSLEEINARLDLMQSLGVTNVRIMVPWASVHPAPPEWGWEGQWSQLDMVVNAAAARDMGILGVLQATPLWATSTTPINGMPEDVNQFAAFAKEAALRYGDKILAYEVWNEPNAQLYFNPASPENYTELLKVTYTALKEAAAIIGEDITVVGGVLGSGQTWGDFTLNPVDFVQRMYAAGADGYFDALSFHPYNYEWKFSGEGIPGWQLGQPWVQDLPQPQLNAIREIMDSYLAEGEEQLKIWISEYGLPTNKVSPEKQAAFIRDMIEFWQTVEGAGPLFIYTIQDTIRNYDPQNDEHNLGIFDRFGNPKLAAQVIKDLIEYLGTDPEWPDPGEGPFDPPSNPLAAVLQALQQLVSNVVSIIPNLVNAVGTFITNVVKGIFGGILGVGATSAASAAALRSAGLDAEGKATDPKDLEADALDGDAKSKDSEAKDTAAKEADAKDSEATDEAKEGDAQEEGAAEEGVTEEEGTGEDEAAGEEGATEDEVTEEEGAAEDEVTEEEGTGEDEAAGEEGATEEEGAAEDEVTEEEGTNEDEAAGEEGAVEDEVTEETPAEEPTTPSTEPEADDGDSAKDDAKDDAAEKTGDSETGSVTTPKDDTGKAAASAKEKASTPDLKARPEQNRRAVSASKPGSAASAGQSSAPSADRRTKVGASTGSDSTD